MTLTDFLLARITEDEARAPRKRGDYRDRPCPRCGRPVSGLGSPLDEEAVRALHEPSRLGCGLDMDDWAALMPDLGPSPEGIRVLAECEAKRRIVEDCYVADCIEDDLAVVDETTRATPYVGERILRALALPYADHPDYREEWKP